MLERRRVHAMLQEQQQQQQPGFNSLSAGMLPSYGSSGAMRSSGSAGSNGRKGSRLPSPAGVVSSSTLGGLPMELPALPVAAVMAEQAAGSGAGDAAVAAGAVVAAAKHRRTDSLLAAAGKRVSIADGG
jgi:hypothetical protein